MSECPYCNNSFDMNETCHDEFRMWQGLVGPYYSPVIENGVLTWTNTGGLPNPDPISVVGPPGNGLYIGGMVETVSDLPETAEDGATWLVGTDDPYEGYVFLDGSWVSIGQLALGPAGPAGPIGPTGPVGPAGSIGPPGIEVSTTEPTSDVLAWIDPDEDTEILIPEMHTTLTPNVLDMGSEYLDAAAVYDTTQGQTQAAINARTITVGAFEQKTMPFVTPSAGNVLVRINPSSSAGGYVSISFGGTNAIVSSANGNGSSLNVVVPGGATITQVSSNNVSVTVFFSAISI